MSIGPTPPQSGPMLSPDGKWVWDGTQWQPIAQHESVFPNWQGITVEPSAPAPRAASAPVAVLTQPIDPALAFPSMPESGPLWKRREPKSTGMNWYLYFIGGVVGIVIVLVVLNSVFPLWLFLPGPKPAPAAPVVKGSPIPALAHRSDAARADYFVNGVLAASLDDLLPALTAVYDKCSKALTNSCQDALVAGRPKVKSTLSVFDKSSVPLCIAAQTAKARADLVGMDAALQSADKAYTDNQNSELAAAMARYSKFAQPFGPDILALTAAAKSASCDAAVTGP